ncbi:MAG: Hsp20/alpha crystallin family protein [Myxococcota bacterium]
MAWYDSIKRGTDEFLENLAEGWDKLRRRSATALTRFTRGAAPAEEGALPAPEETWGLLSAEVSELGKEVVVRVEAPGMNREDFTLAVERGHLFVRGEKRFEHEEKGAHYHLFESAYGSFQRAIPLPCEVRVEEAEAQYKRGVLTVRMPRAAAATGRQIPIGT